MGEITLDTWIEQRRQEIDHFADHWSDIQAREGRQDWPEKMLPGEWDEQFSAYREVEQ